MSAVTPEFYDFIKKLEDNDDKLVPSPLDQPIDFEFNVRWTIQICVNFCVFKYLIKLYIFCLRIQHVVFATVIMDLALESQYAWLVMHFYFQIFHHFALIHTTIVKKRMMATRGMMSLQILILALTGESTECVWCLLGGIS